MRKQRFSEFENRFCRVIKPPYKVENKFNLILKEKYSIALLYSRLFRPVTRNGLIKIVRQFNIRCRKKFIDKIL